MTINMIRTLVTRNDWERILPMVFSTGPAEPAWKQSLLAVSLAAGKRVAASHGTAGFLWNLEGVTRRGVEMTSMQRVRTAGPHITVHETTRPFAIHFVDALPVTSVDRTLLDLATCLGPDALEVAFEDALRRRLTTEDRVRAALETHGGRGRPGTRALAAMLRERGKDLAATESSLETRVVRELRAARLPAPVRQHPVRCLDGTIRRIDLAYPHALLGIEVDGFRWHSGRKAWHNDRGRANALAAVGWTLTRATKEDADGSCRKLVATVAAILARVTPDLFSERDGA
jgi:very-short-patch-repair endonuclease